MDLALNAAGPGSEVELEAVIVDGSPERNVIGPLNGKLAITGGDETVATLVEGDTPGHYTAKVVSGKITTEPVTYSLTSADHPELTGVLNVTVPNPGPPAGVDLRPVVQV